MDLNTIEESVCRFGLRVMGGFHGDEDQTMVLIGNAGPKMWAAFVAATSADERTSGADPLDGWTRRVLDEAAEELRARALFPFDGPPYHPFQQWALRTGTAFVSPTGPLIHPKFGLWLAYRGALAFQERLDLGAPPGAKSPCMTCTDKPCLGACPADAFKPDETQEGGAVYDASTCVAHIGSTDGKVCFEGGCLARHACPVGQEYAYEVPQANFHMMRYLKAQGGL